MEATAGWMDASAGWMDASAGWMETADGWMCENHRIFNPDAVHPCNPLLKPAGNDRATWRQNCQARSSFRRVAYLMRKVGENKASTILRGWMKTTAGWRCDNHHMLGPDEVHPWNPSLYPQATIVQHGDTTAKRGLHFDE